MREAPYDVVLKPYGEALKALGDMRAATWRSSAR